MNWLALGQRRSPPDYARAGFPVSAGQEAMIERLEDLVEYYLGCGEVTLDNLGRAGEKLKNLSAAAFTLPNFSKEFEFDDIASFLTSFNPLLIRTRIHVVAIVTVQKEGTLAKALLKTTRVHATRKSCL